jgi:hypothetical protein
VVEEFEQVHKVADRQLEVGRIDWGLRDEAASDFEYWTTLAGRLVEILYGARHLAAVEAGTSHVVEPVVEADTFQVAVPVVGVDTFQVAAPVVEVDTSQVAVVAAAAHIE